MPPFRNLTSLYVLIPAFLLIWSSVFAVAGLALAHASPMSVLAIRFGIAAIIAAALAAIMQESRPKIRDAAAAALIGVVNHTVYLGMSYMGMRHVPAGLTSVIVSANPVLTAVLAAALLSEAMTLRKAVGLILGVLGVAFILRHRINAGTDRLEDLLWPLGALAALSAGTILFKRLGAGAGGFSALAIQLAAASLAAALPAWLFERGDVLEFVPEFWFSIMYQAVLASIGAYAIWFHLLRTSSAAAASAWHFLIPPLGIMFGVLILNETVFWADFIGIIPVGLGIWLVNRSGRFLQSRPQH